MLHFMLCSLSLKNILFQLNHFPYGEKLYFLLLNKCGGNCCAIVFSYQTTKWLFCFPFIRKLIVNMLKNIYYYMIVYFLLITFLKVHQK